MLSEFTEVEISLLEEDLEEISSRLDFLTDNDAEIRNDLLRQQRLLITDLEKANKKLVSELKCVRNQQKFSEF